MLASLFFQKHLIHPETYGGVQFKQVWYIRQQSVKQMIVLGHPVGEQVVSLVVDTHEVEMFVHGKVQLPLELVHRVLDMRLAHAPYTIHIRAHFVVYFHPVFVQTTKSRPEVEVFRHVGGARLHRKSPLREVDGDFVGFPEISDVCVFLGHELREVDLEELDGVDESLASSAEPVHVLQLDGVQLAEVRQDLRGDRGVI